MDYDDLNPPLPPEGPETIILGLIVWGFILWGLVSLVRWVL